MRYIGSCASALLIAAGLTGCYPDGPEYIDEYDLVYTNYSPTYDFKAQSTYALPDSVIKLTGNLAEGDAPEFVNQVYANELLGRVRANMSAYGWTEVDEAENPDVIILPTAVSSTTVSVWYSWGYWGSYYPWYGYGWYYPGYYPPTVSAYTSGSIFLQMVDPGEVSGTDNLAVEWICVVNGLLEGSSSGLIARIDKSVDQAFKQSAYLKQ